MKIYPPASVSRTLDPTNKSFTTVVGRHDQRLSDADVNLIQDLQDFKRSQQIDNTIFSGALSYAPFRFDPTKSNTFTISAFDVMFNGEVVNIGGHNANDLNTNKIILPQPTTSPTPNLYVIYLELWYSELNPLTGKGYSSDGKIYPNGCISIGDSSLLITDDVVDSFNNLTTTIRSQIQWTIRATPIDLAYDFSTLNYGLDPGPTDNQKILAQGPMTAYPSNVALAFSNMGVVNGDYGLWVGGASTLPTLDGFSYAMPIAVVFRRDLDIFDQSLTPFGSATPAPNSGLINLPANSPADPSFVPVSGRYDGKYADSVYDSDVVDTRMTVALQGYDNEKLVKNGFVDLINGNTQLKIGRGDGAGNTNLALGSRLGYTIAISPPSTPPSDNVRTIGSFNNFINGFSLDNRPFYTIKTMPISAKTIGNQNGPWVNGDQFSITLPTNYIFSYIIVQGLTKQSNVYSTVLLNGQVAITGMGTASLTGTFIQNPLPAYDPGYSPLQVFIGVEATASVLSTKKVPFSMDYGILVDSNISGQIATFAVSDFSSSKTLGHFTSFNPNRSNKNFGTLYSLAKTVTGVSSVTIQNSELPYRGAYVVDVVGGATITSQSVTNAGITVTLGSAFTGTLVFSIMLLNVAQMGYNAPVKGITSIKETILFGFGSVISLLDSRVTLVGTNVGSSNTTYIFSTTDSVLSGVAGGYIFSQNLDGSFSPVATSSITYANGYVIVVAPNTVTANFFLIGSLAPAFSSDSSLVASFEYIPYQGEGKANTDYALLYSEDFALITTNGTGSAPVVGLKDVFPYNRELPLTVSLPALSSWDDSELKNQAIATEFDNNYATKQFNNTDHTFMVPLKTNDFIEPVSGWKSKIIRFGTSGPQGFTTAYPHVGFAVIPPKPKSIAGNFVYSTSNPINVYVSNTQGDDTQDGLSRLSPKKTILSALQVLPPVLKHPCCIFLINTGQAYQPKNAEMTMAKLGDGLSNPVNYYTIGNLTFTIQDEGLLYIGRESGVSQRITIDSSLLTPFSDGSTSAFTIVNSSVVFGGIQFKGFINEALYGANSRVSFADCAWLGNQIAGSFFGGCDVSVDSGLLTVDYASTGFRLSTSDLTSSDLDLTYIPPVFPATGSTNGFYVCERGAHLTINTHTANNEIGILTSTFVVNASLNSSVVCGANVTSGGMAALAMNSVLTSFATTPDATFAGNVTGIVGNPGPNNDTSSSWISTS